MGSDMIPMSWDMQWDDFGQSGGKIWCWRLLGRFREYYVP